VGEEKEAKKGKLLSNGVIVPGDSLNLSEWISHTRRAHQSLGEYGKSPTVDFHYIDINGDEIDCPANSLSFDYVSYEVREPV